MPIQLNAIVDRGINVALSRRLGLTDTSVSLMPELGPVLSVGAPWLPEMDYHLGWRRFAAAGNIPALAANFPTVNIRMPRNANIVCVVEGFWGAGAAGAALTTPEVTVSGIVNTTDFAAISGGGGRDTRMPASKPGVCVVSTAATANQGLNFCGYTLPTNVMPSWYPLILTPSLIAGSQLDGYSFQLQQANVSFDWMIWYRERVLNDQENVI